jgi:hypothetical protein
MPILELFPKPDRGTDPSSGDPNTSGRTPPPPRSGDGTQRTAVATAIDPAEIDAPAPVRHAHHRRTGAIKLHTRRYGELEEHELIHLIDSLDDERSRARFRESVYISVIIWLIVGWFLIYGPRVLFHVPQYRDPIAALKEHDRQITLNLPKTPPVPRIAPKIDPKTMAALQRQAELERQARRTPPTPQPPESQAPPPEVAHNTAPPVAQPQLPVAPAPKPTPSVSSPLPDAPSFARNNPGPRDSGLGALRGGRTGAELPLPPNPGSAGPLRGGTQILSDTQGVDFSAYMRKFQADVQHNWEPLIPIEVQPPIRKRGITGIILTILPDGQIGGMTLETRSGDVALDHAAWSAILSEGQFPPLPSAFHGPNLMIRCGFYYNEPIE